jgi:hypothetical protein
MVFPINNPLPTTNAAGTFLKSTAGYIQGTALNDPAVRFALAGGILGPNETLPMWGGVGIAEAVTPLAASGKFPLPNLGGYITRATTLSLNNAGTLTGWSVFDQDHAWINSPQSPVPTANVGMPVNFYRFGSGARIAVGVDPTYAAGLLGGTITQQSSWDFNDQILQQYDASTATYAISSLTWSSTNGGQVAVVTSAATPTTGVGDVINISGVTSNSGTGSISLINGQQTINTWTDNEHFTFLLPGTSAVWGTIGLTSAVINYGTGLLNVKILDIQTGNSMTPVYNPVTGNVTWNYAGNTAIILI